MADRLGRYRLQEVIGVGSFATVHRAIDERLEDMVVIKVLAENHSLNPEVRERFITEGRSLRRVASPHVVTIHDIGESERQQPFLVLSYADRGTLADRIGALRLHGWVPAADDVLIIARSLAAAVEAVHQANLVHRDLSPGNVLLTTVPQRQRHSGAEVWGDAGEAAVVAGDERLVVADLGMCKDLALNSGLTVAGGTTGFRPPEQDGPGMIDTRADLWAMSQLLLWLCAGSGPALPDQLFTALRRSTARDPDDRHRDAADWLIDIEQALRPPEPPLVLRAPVQVPGVQVPMADGAAPPVPVGAAGHAGRKRPHRCRFAVLAGLLTLLLIGVGAFLGGLWGGSTTPSRSAQAVIAIEGPEQVRVGQEATFTAHTEEVEAWVWTLPTGQHLVDEPAVSITASSAGPAEVMLRARAPDGTDLEMVHAFTVTE